MNYFELFSIPVMFSVDQTNLSSTYRELQQQFHPDNFVMHSDAERLVAMQKSTEINDAYQTLKNSCLRAEYLLALSGYDIALQNTLQDTDFLIQQMQWREKLENFTEDDEDQLSAFSNVLSEQVGELEALLAEQLGIDNLAGSADSIRKLKFMFKLQEELALLEEKLFD
ncbi:co-chaperone HscB [Psychromonas sp. PT13]|uniref:co-chaperone HscB n=1 Tax=Psychromonas sp. PT13 TaxID=3439547 RepID=UPI003EBAC74F